MHEELHRAVIKDYDHRIVLYRQERNKLEEGLIAQALKPPENRFATTKAAFETAMTKTREWIEKVKPARRVGPKENWIFRNYWRKQNRVMPGV